MSWQKAFASVEAQLAKLRNRDILSDRDIAEAIRSAAWRQDVPATLAGDEAAEALVFRLAWWLFVRAPSLDVRYFLIGPMSLDLAVRGERTLDEVMDELRSVEESGGGDEADVPTDVDFLEEHRATFQKHASLVDEIDQLDRDALTEPIAESMTTILANEGQFRKLYAALTDQLVEEFDELARSGAFEDVMHGHAHDHTHEDYEALDSADDYVARAEERFAHGDLHGAIDDCNAALELDPDQVDAYLQRGVARAAHDDIQDAIVDFGEALQREPENVAALINRGLAYYGTEQFDEALVDFDDAADADPEAAEVFANRGIVRAALGDADGAVDDFDQAIELDPASVIAYTNRALVHRSEGDLREAILDYQKAVDLDPNYAEAWSALGFIFLSTEYFEEAVEHLSRAIELQPFAGEHYYNRGNAYAGLEEFEKAIEDYTKAIELDEEDIQSYLNRGLARLKRQDFNGAIDDWTRAIDIDPYDPMPYAKRAGVWNLLDQPAEAANDLHHALELAPDDWEYKDFANDMLADIVEQMGYDPSQMD